MDYDRTEIPAGYDRTREHGPEVLDLWMRALEPYIRRTGTDAILDLGCGTGRFSDALAVHFNAEVVGVDPSVKMLGQAHGKEHRGRVRYQLGSAEAIPLLPDSVDAIFMSMSFHHFVDRAQAARECRRVLRKQGVVCVRTASREQIQSYAYLPYFPSTPSLLHENLPDLPALREPFETAGFRLRAATIITQTIASSWTAYAEKLAAGGDSILARLSPGEFEDGLAALRRRDREMPDHPIVEPIDLLVFD
jgi:ubiquinone/menaquinone biosynthesis C-methylase UbiE